MTIRIVDKFLEHIYCFQNDRSVMVNENFWIMARTREYNKEEVIEVATKLFWQKGYNATSMNDLVKHTGLNKQSMYKEFGDKENFFLACLSYYVIEDSKEVRKILTKQPLSLNNVEEFIENRIDYAASDNCNGCLLVNSIVEKESLSKNINERVYSILKGQEALIHMCLNSAKENGDISNDNDCEALSTYLSVFFRGLMNAGRTSIDKSSMKKIRDLIMCAIKK